MRRSDICYRVFGFEFKDHADGSLYLETGSTAKGVGIPPRRLKISYHATGRINYRGVVDAEIYAEPIFALTCSQHLICLSLSDLDSLPAVDAAHPDDHIIEVSESDLGRVNLYVSIAPLGTQSAETSGICITYPDWFTLHVSPGPLPKQDMKSEESHVFVPEGKFQSQLVGQEQALIFFHQKKTGSRGLILYWDPQQRHFRTIFAVPMRIPPTLIVTFVEPGLEAVPLEPIVRNTATAELRFRVRGRGGFLNEPPQILALALDAEFYD